MQMAKYNHLPELAAELVSLKVDVIVTSGAGAGLAAKNATDNNPNCLRFSSRSGCNRARRQSGKAGREHHRIEQSRPGIKRKETGANQRGCSQDHTGSFSLEFRPRGNASLREKRLRPRLRHWDYRFNPWRYTTPRISRTPFKQQQRAASRPCLRVRAPFLTPIKRESSNSSRRTGCQRCTASPSLWTPVA